MEDGRHGFGDGNDSSSSAAPAGTPGPSAAAATAVPVPPAAKVSLKIEKSETKAGTTLDAQKVSQHEAGGKPGGVLEGKERPPAKSAAQIVREEG